MMKALDALQHRHLRRTSCCTRIPFFIRLDLRRIRFWVTEKAVGDGLVPEGLGHTRPHQSRSYFSSLNSSKILTPSPTLLVSTLHLCYCQIPPSFVSLIAFLPAGLCLQESNTSLEMLKEERDAFQCRPECGHNSKTKYPLSVQ